MQPFLRLNRAKLIKKIIIPQAKYMYLKQLGKKPVKQHILLLLHKLF